MEQKYNRFKNRYRYSVRRDKREYERRCAEDVEGQKQQKTVELHEEESRMGEQNHTINHC